MTHYINVKPKGNGHWELSFCYNGQNYRTTTNDSQLIDRIYEADTEEDNETINEIWKKLTEKL